MTTPTAEAMLEIARPFFDAWEKGEGWEGCRQLCQDLACPSHPEAAGLGATFRSDLPGKSQSPGMQEATI